MSHKKLLYGSLVVLCIAAVVSMFMLGSGKELSAAGYGANCQNCDDQFDACTQRCDNAPVTAHKSQCYDRCNEAYDRCMTLCKCTIAAQESFQECMKKATTPEAKEACRTEYMERKKECYEKIDQMESDQRLIE